MVYMDKTYIVLRKYGVEDEEPEIMAVFTKKEEVHSFLRILATQLKEINYQSFVVRVYKNNDYLIKDGCFYLDSLISNNGIGGNKLFEFLESDM